MKLLTHNMLTSKCLKNVQVGFPLKIVANEMKETKVDYNQEFVQRMITKLDWPALYEAAKTIGVEIPAEPPVDSGDSELLKQIHHAIFEVEVMDGDLVCPETGRKFPIKHGIPNMLCNEDEV